MQPALTWVKAEETSVCVYIYTHTDTHTRTKTFLKPLGGKNI